MLTKPSNLHASLKMAIKYLVPFLGALNDPEMRFLQQGAAWRVVGEWAAYGATAATVRLTPTAREIDQADVVDSWLGWLSVTHGKPQQQRIIKWANGFCIDGMARKEKCSARTITNRIDRSIGDILKQFYDVESDICTIEEGPDKPVQYFSSPAVSVATGIRQGTFDKVWIDGIGFMKDGRRINSGDDRILRRVM